MASSRLLTLCVASISPLRIWGTGAGGSTTPGGGKLASRSAVLVLWVLLMPVKIALLASALTAW